MQQLLTEPPGCKGQGLFRVHTGQPHGIGRCKQQRPGPLGGIFRHRFLPAALSSLQGSGGILCPLRWDAQHIQLEDVVKSLGLASILVAEAGLGTINSVVLTAEYMKAKGLPLKGIIFNHYHPGDTMEEDNLAMCQALTGLPILATVQEGDTALRMDPEALAALYEEVKL